MAEAKRKFETKKVKKQVTEMVPVTKEVEVNEKVENGVTLELTRFEALTLADILARVGGMDRTIGNAKISRRKFAQNILNALRSTGYDYDVNRSSNDLDGGMSFGSSIEDVFPDYKENE